MKSNKVVDALLGVAIGDAVGVPYEFTSREEMQANPATDKDCMAPTINQKELGPTIVLNILLG